MGPSVSQALLGPSESGLSSAGGETAEAWAMGRDCGAGLELPVLSAQMESCNGRRRPR